MSEELLKSANKHKREMLICSIISLIGTIILFFGGDGGGEWGLTLCATIVCFGAYLHMVSLIKKYKKLF